MTDGRDITELELIDAVKQATEKLFWYSAEQGLRAQRRNSLLTATRWARKEEFWRLSLVQLRAMTPRIGPGGDQLRGAS